jgi:outer membrane protein
MTIFRDINPDFLISFSSLNIYEMILKSMRLKMKKATRFYSVFLMVILYLFAYYNTTFSFAETLDDQNLKVLDLETAQKIALEKNPSIAAAQERVRQAKERIYQAQSAYWPQVNASFAISRVELSNNTSQTPFAGFGSSNVSFLSVESPQDYYTADLIASWVLFDGFERKFNVSAAKFQHQETRAAQNDAYRLLLSAVSQAYFNALLARENIRIAEADQAFNQRQLEEARARQRIGTGSLSDVLNFQVQINTARSGIIGAQESYRIAIYVLAALLGQDNDFFEAQVKPADLMEETAEELQLPDPEILVKTAQIYRPDLFQAEYAVNRFEQQIGAAKAVFYPTVQLSGTLTGERPNSGRLSQDDFGNVVALSIQYNLFSGGFYKAQLNEAISIKKEAEKNLTGVIINIRSEVRETMASLESARELLILQRSNAELVRQNRDLVEKEYAAGQTSLVRLNEAQRDLINAQSQMALALVSLKQAWQDLKAATGEILIPFSTL